MIRNRFSIVVLAAALAGCSEDITVINMSPTPTIAAPAHESSFMSGDVITSQGSATDPEDGMLTGSSLAWASHLDGEIRRALA